MVDEKNTTGRSAAESVRAVLAHLDAEPGQAGPRPAELLHTVMAHFDVLLETLRVTLRDATRHDLLQWLAASAVAACAQLFFAISGMGAAIGFQFGWYVLSLFQLSSGQLADGAALVTLWTWPLALLQTMALRRHIHFRSGIVLGVTGALSSVVGVLVLTQLADTNLKVAFGVLLLVLCLCQTQAEMRPEDPHKDLRLKGSDLMPPALVAGIFAGVLGGMFATPSPALMVYVLYARVGKDESRATSAFALSAFWLPTRLYLFERFAVDVSFVAGPCICCVFGGACGLCAGNSLARHVSEAQFRWLLLGLLHCAGLVFLLSGCSAVLAALASACFWFLVAMRCQTCYELWHGND